MVDIPPEIWLHILQFLPKEELYRLISVNRLFLEVGMNLKWESVELSNTSHTSGLPSTMQTLKRLSDPFVASKLRILNIDATFMEPTSSDVTDIDNPTVFIFPTFDELIDGIVQAAPHFQNITYVDLTCWMLSPSCNPEILRSMWFPMSQSLKVLSLGGSLGAYRVLIESLPPMPQLDELRLLFIEEHVLDESGQLAILISHVVPYINSIGPRLRLLSIYSWTNVDLSVLFKNLHTPPALRELAISFSFNTSLADPPQLNRFLKRCSDTVVSLGLSLQDGRDKRDVSGGQRRDEWLMDLFSADNQCLTNLEDLNISFRTVKDRAVDILTACLQKTQRTLQELCVRDRFLNRGEFSRVLDAAANCMKLNCLWINIDRVDWDVIEMLAPKLPRIRRLFIVTPALAILSSERAPDEMSTHYPTATAQLLEHRVCKHLQWKLHVAELWEDGGGRLKIENTLTTA
ncbi:hypothetical protein D9613_007508 [Agrocybe pediades]|uniref:F-box domain-containing protein n=1 Tax=Agrocybe pediades TaxID=84607 RepID=A0A8H4VJV0_9AGAR|nr:hypothetical protein D9613_007508 [Agrocybe pediades]